jgi:hypothetical protein
MDNLIYDISLLSAIIVGGYILSTLAYNAVEVMYWKYRDWRIRKDDESR